MSTPRTQRSSEFPAVAPTASRGGFSLVEVTIAIGIFAFVVVGIIGIFPTALKLRSESALDTRAFMIAQQLVASVQGSPNISNVAFRDGPAMGSGNTRNVNLTNGPVVLGYQVRSAMPYFYYQVNPGASWTNAGGMDAQITTSAVNEINTLAMLSATIVPGFNNLYNVTVQVRSPATLALSNTRPVVFTTMVSFTNL
jgi:type II secretory pathway pseudopilin PulG